MVKVAIIGGSGLENPERVQHLESINVETPFGNPSSNFRVGKVGNVEVVVLSRHGRNHSTPPSQVNNRANIWAIKELGCTHILATTACGSLREEIKRGDIVILDQFIDFTKHRKNTFHEIFLHGEIKHTQMGDPFDHKLCEKLIQISDELNLSYHKKGTVITIEGPRFSTRAESNMFRSWGADVINMSIAPECILANEIGIPYAAIALSTDYDCWKTDETEVSWEEVLKVFNENVEKVIDLLMKTIPAI